MLESKVEYTRDGAPRTWPATLTAYPEGLVRVIRPPEDYEQDVVLLKALAWSGMSLRAYNLTSSNPGGAMMAVSDLGRRATT